MRRSVKQPVSILTLHIALTTAFAYNVALFEQGAEPRAVVVDMASSAGRNVEVFVNDLSLPPLRQALVPGVRRLYRFENVTEDIAMLRLDPTEAANADVELYSIDVTGSRGLLAHFGAPTLADWARANVDVRSVDGSALRLRTTTNDPILTSEVSVRVGEAAMRWLPRADHRQFAVRLVIVAVLGLAALGLLDRARRLHLFVCAVTLAVTVPLVFWIASLPLGAGSPRVAVSRATFFGASLRAQQIALLAPVVVSGLLGVLIAWGVRFASRHPRVGPWVGCGESGGDDGYSAVDSVRGPTWRVALAVVATLLVTVPDVASAVQGALGGSFAPHWDSDNLAYWSYLVHTGALPFRDFWYPYGGFYLFELPLPWGPLVHWLYEACVLVIFLYTCMGLSRRFGVAVLLTGLLVAGDRLGLLPGLFRYILSINLVLTYLLVEPRPWHSRIPFWAACCVALFFEPSQLLLAAVPIAVLIASDLLERRSDETRGLRAALTRLATNLIVPAAFAALYASWLAIRGQLGGWLGFNFRLGDAVAYGAIPTNLRGVWRQPFGLQAAAVAAPSILVSLGFYERVARQTDSRYGGALVGVGLLLLMVLQKHAVRPMEEQTMLLLAVGAFVYCAFWPGRRHTVEYLVIGALLGALITHLTTRPGVRAIVAAMATAPERVISVANVLVTYQERFAPANRARFAPERFTSFAAERQVADRLRALVRPPSQPEVFALTDSPVLYILTGQPPVWLSNTYNASPIYEQIRMVEWLRRDQPQFVVVDQNRLDWDFFQNAVRVPLIYGEVALHYVPLERVGRVDILRRRGSSEAVDLSFWRACLSAEINLGHLPRLSSFRPGRLCEESACQEYLEVTVTGEPPAARQATVPFEVGGLEFVVSFEIVPHHRVYYVSLDRLWFWYVARQAGFPRRVVTGRTEGTSVRVVNGPTDDGVLY